MVDVMLFSQKGQSHADLEGGIQLPFERKYELNNSNSSQSRNTLLAWAVRKETQAAHLSQPSIAHSTWKQGIYDSDTHPCT